MLSSPRSGTVLLIVALAMCGGKGEASADTSLTSVSCPDGATVGNRIVCPPSPRTLLDDHSATQVSRGNPEAADLADHWHRSVAPDTFIHALGLLSGGHSPSDDLAALLGATALGDGSGPAAHFPDAGAVETLGTAVGFTVGRWTAGPGDNLPITVDWRLAPDVSAEARARARRVAKFWSHRLSDTFDPYVIRSGRSIGVGEALNTWPEDTKTHGLYLIARPDGTGLLQSIGVQRSASTYRGRMGTFSALWVTDNNLDAFGVWVGRNLAYQLGIRGHQSAGHASSLPNQYTDVADGTWTGPNATAEYGGPVPFWRRADGSVNYVGLDRSACPSAASLCHPRVQLPQAIDLAFLADLGYTIADETVLDEPERYGIGSWGRATAWTLTVERELNGFTRDRLQAFADVFGAAPAQTFAEANREAVGRAVWHGFLLGTDLGQLALPPVTGSVRITIDLAALTGTAEFSDLQSLVAGRAEPFRMSRLSYDVSVDGNRFRDADERLHGAWYGDDHVELAGTLLDTRGDVDLLAAFGGTSMPPLTVQVMRENPTAADLADHWHRTRMVGAVGAALGLSRFSPGDDHAAQDVFDTSGVSASPGNVDRVSFRAADPVETVALGTVDGITVGRWTAGPADTLPIQVDWSLFGDDPPPPEALVRSARAARNLGRHFRDDVGEHTLAAGTVLWNGLVWPEDTTTNGLLVAMIPPMEDRPPFALPLRPAFSVDGDYQPWLGVIHMPAVHLDRVAAQNVWNYDWVYSHELVHVLGTGAVTHQFPYFDREAAVWNGPNAVAVHGGPVPFRRRQDGTIDFTHIDAGACPSVVTAFLACDGPESTASALDLAILADLGYQVLDPETATDTEIYSLGAWNDEAAWGVLVARDLAARPTADNRTLYDHDRLTASAEAFGVEPESSFADAHRGLTGEATWRGVLLGVDLADPALAPLAGRATVRVDLATFDAKADFDGLSVLERGIPKPFRVTELSYDVLVNESAFGDLDGKVHGRWYGSSHDTVAGVLDDRDPAVNVLGAFGGAR